MKDVLNHYHNDDEGCLNHYHNDDEGYRTSIAMMMMLPSIVIVMKIGFIAVVIPIVITAQR